MDLLARSNGNGTDVDATAPVAGQSDDMAAASGESSRVDAVDWTRISAYLEYSSTQHFPELIADTGSFAFIGPLERHEKHENLWINNGKALGKLHFDPFDNLLVQVRFVYRSLSLLLPRRPSS